MARPVLLDADEVRAIAVNHPEWELVDGTHMRRSVTFDDFAQAWLFMGQVASIAEALNHHPDWSNSWNRVDIAITTHDRGGLTALDRSFVARVDAALHAHSPDR